MSAKVLRGRKGPSLKAYIGSGRHTDTRSNNYTRRVDTVEVAVCRMRFNACQADIDCIRCSCRHIWVAQATVASYRARAIDAWSKECPTCNCAVLDQKTVNALTLRRRLLARSHRIAYRL